MYRRSVLPAFGTTSPLGRVEASAGAGGAIPRGGAALPAQRNGRGADVNRLGGLLGMMKNLADREGNGVNGSAAVSALAENLASGTGPGEIPNNLGTLSFGGSGGGVFASPALNGGFSGAPGTFGSPGASGTAVGGAGLSGATGLSGPGGLSGPTGFAGLTGGSGMSHGGSGGGATGPEGLVSMNGGTGWPGLWSSLFGGL